MQEEQLKKLEDFKGKYTLMQRELEDKQTVIDDLQKLISAGGSDKVAMEAENNRKLFK
jgi:hypothetical protein